MSLSLPLCIFTEDSEFPFFIQYGHHDEQVYMHSHKDFDELVIVLDGSAIHLVDNEEYVINKGDVFVIGNNTEHGYTNVNNFKICNIMYRKDFALNDCDDITMIAGYHALFVLEPHLAREHSFKSRLKLTHNEFIQITSMIDIMIKEYNNNKPGRKTLLKAHFINLIIYLSRIYKFENSENTHDIINIAQAISYIENHFNENISLDYLAGISHYSKRHFIRIFESTYHTTPLEYVINLRINHACIMLKNSSASITEIAEKCGFGTTNYFSRIFKKKLMISPSDYRKNIENIY